MLNEIGKKALFRLLLPRIFYSTYLTVSFSMHNFSNRSILLSYFLFPDFWFRIFPRRKRKFSRFNRREIRITKIGKEARKFLPPLPSASKSCRQSTTIEAEDWPFFLFGLVFPLPCNSSGCTLGLTFDDATIFIRAAHGNSILVTWHTIHKEGSRQKEGKGGASRGRAHV